MTRRTVLLPLILAASLVSALPAVGQEARARVLTDISNEPDDEQSLVRFLVYANEFEIEGLVATTSTWLRQSPREDVIRRQLAAYAEVQPNLAVHAPGYPPAEQLAAVNPTTAWNLLERKKAPPDRNTSSPRSTGPIPCY